MGDFSPSKTGAADVVVGGASAGAGLVAGMMKRKFSKDAVWGGCPPFAPRRGGFFLPLDAQGGTEGGLGVALNFVHPLRAALRLPASPSRGEGEVFSSPLMSKGELKGV